MSSPQPAQLAYTHRSLAAPAARMLPALLALLLLALPALCVVHCLVAMRPAHYATPAAGDGAAHFLCDLPAPAAAASLFTPAYLPGVLLRLVTFGVTISLLRTLLLIPPHPLRPVLLAPPTPPPRSAG